MKALGRILLAAGLLAPAALAHEGHRHGAAAPEAAPAAKPAPAAAGAGHHHDSPMAGRW